MRAALALSAVLLGAAGCRQVDPPPPDDDDTVPELRDGELDLSELPDGRVDAAYAGQVSVIDYDGPARFFAGSDLPDGLQMRDDGVVVGTPTVEGEFEFRVVAADLVLVRDFTTDVTMRILPALATDPFVGFVHHRNNMWDERRLMGGPWVRVSGGGEPGADVFVFDFGVYEAGDDGDNDRGADDDVRLFDLTADELTITVEPFVFTAETGPNGDRYPSGHYNEDDPPQVDASTGTVTAGADTGDLVIELSHPEYGVTRTHVMVLPPDWCPAGEAEIACE